MKRVLPVYPWPMHQKVADVLATMEVMPVMAGPGSPGPVLAIMKAPPFICDAIVVQNPDRLVEAVHIVTGDGLLMVSMREQVARVFHVETGVTEEIERVVSRVKFE